MQSGIMKIAALQMKCRIGDVVGNLNHALELIREACRDKVDLICFPESALDGYACGQTGLAAGARTTDGPETGRIAALARTQGVWILWTLAEKWHGGIANSAVIIDRSGTIRMTYRKAHLCREVNEHLAYVPGEDFPVVDMDGLTAGAMICFDRHFPEAARTLRLKGANLILHPTATDWFKPDPTSLNTAMMRTRSYENRCFILSVNQANYGGGSALFGPWGEVMAVAGRDEEILRCAVDPATLEARPDNTFELLSVRQPDLYA